MVAGPIGPLVRSKPRGWAIGRMAIIGPSPYRGPLSMCSLHPTCPPAHRPAKGPASWERPHLRACRTFESICGRFTRRRPPPVEAPRYRRDGVPARLRRGFQNFVRYLTIHP